MPISRKQKRTPDLQNNKWCIREDAYSRLVGVPDPAHE